MAKLSYLKEKLIQMSSFLETHSAFINAHMVDFFTHDHWCRLLHPQLADEILKFIDNMQTNLNMKQKLLISQNGQDHNYQVGPPNFDEIRGTNLQAANFPKLKEFLEEAEKHTLTGLDVCTPVETLLQNAGSQVSDCGENDRSSEVFPSHLNKWLMSSKKKHEVEAMGKLVAMLSFKHNTKTVIDCGSGKGYLSFYLAAKHQLDVLGLDSQATNTCSANVRTEKMVHALKKSRKKTVRLMEEDMNNHKSTNDSAPSLMNHQANRTFDHNKNENLVHPDHKISKEALNFRSGLFYPVTAVINKDTDLEKLLDRFKSSKLLVSEIEDKNVNHCVDLDGSEKHNVIMCGLHTCGSLATNMIHMFLAHKSAIVLCDVGCCYHLLTEEYGTNDPAKKYEPKNQVQMDVGFPLSKILREKKFSLGRNARMLSSQPLDRISENKMRYPRSLFYRALLQKLLLEKLEEQVELLVGRTGLKATSFVDYTRKVETKFPFLNLDVSDKELDVYASCHEQEEQKLLAFQQLRTILAPCIEAIILLDRLVFLIEQESIKEAHLVKLFDPVTSPRCYAIVAIKDSPVA